MCRCTMETEMREQRRPETTTARLDMYSWGQCNYHHQLTLIPTPAVQQEDVKGAMTPSIALLVASRRCDNLYLVPWWLVNNTALRQLATATRWWRSCTSIYFSSSSVLSTQCKRLRCRCTLFSTCHESSDLNLVDQYVFFLWVDILSSESNDSCWCPCANVYFDGLHCTNEQSGTMSKVKLKGHTWPYRAQYEHT